MQRFKEDSVYDPEIGSDRQEDVQQMRGIGLLQQALVLSLLGICSFEDVRHRRIRQFWLILYGAEALCADLFWMDWGIFTFVTSILPGCVMLVLSKLSRGGVGEGDGMLLIVAGLFLGAQDTVQILFAACVFAAGYAVFLVAGKKKDRKYEIAFVPFLFAAYIGKLLAVG